MARPIMIDPFDEIDAMPDHQNPPLLSYFRLGPFTLCIEAFDTEIESKFIRSLSHLKTEPSAPDLTICIWETKKRKLPPLDWSAICERGYSGYRNGALFFHYFEQIGALSALNIEKNKAHYIVQDSRALPWWVEGSPLQVIFHIWLRERGMQLTHTAAVGDGKNCLLLAGKGGSGKSTTTFACLQNGLFSYGEDYCILDPQPIPEVYSVYQSAKWTPNTVALFPQYAPFIQNRDRDPKDKSLLFYDQIFPGKIGWKAAVQAVVSLELGSDFEPALEEQNAVESLKNLMMSTLLQLPFHNPTTARLLNRVVAESKRYKLILGKNIFSNVRQIRELLKSVQ